METNGDVVSDSAVKVYHYISGRLVSLKVPLGGRVSKGEVLAEVDPSTPGSSFSLNPVLAPISGTVLSLPAAVGSSVGSGTAVAEIGVLEDVQVEARIPERFVGVLRTGLTASVALEAYPKVTFPASVVRVSPIVDPVSRTKTVRLAFDRPDGRINPGMFARIRLNTLAYPDRLIVREDAVRTDSEGTFVFVVRPDSTVEKRRVARGVAVDGTAEIVSGLAEGETVVVEGAAVLSDGAAVRDIGARKVSP
ncbi:MAG: efflux RND transporter periplasmic adaptor subunit [Treponema sp.]|nr:efflux RND transporter periplasmic adaptor subunit [Treponema sp.]